MLVAILEHPPNLKGCVGINASVLNLTMSKIKLIPFAHRNPLRLVKLLRQNFPHQSFQTSAKQIVPPKLISSQRTQINHITTNSQPIKFFKLTQIAVYSNTHERVVLVRQKVYKRLRNGFGVDDLKNQTSALHAELDSGDAVVLSGASVWTPLDVKADNKRVEFVAMDALSLGNPVVNGDFRVGNNSSDLVLEEGDVVHVVGVVRIIMVDYA